MTITALSDAELLDQARNGDEAAFTELYVRHQAAALRLARTYRRLGDPDDLVNGAFERVLGALRRGGRARPSRSGPTCSSRCAGWPPSRESDRPTSSLDDVPEPITAAAAAPELDRADREIISQAFESLPDRWQAVLWHTAVEGRQPAELAGVLGVSANAAAAMAYRAREKLRQSYLQAHLLASPAPEHEPYRVAARRLRARRPVPARPGRGQAPPRQVPVVHGAGRRARRRQPHAGPLGACPCSCWPAGASWRPGRRAAVAAARRRGRARAPARACSARCATWRRRSATPRPSPPSWPASPAWAPVAAREEGPLDSAADAADIGPDRSRIDGGGTSGRSTTATRCSATDDFALARSTATPDDSTRRRLRLRPSSPIRRPFARDELQQRRRVRRRHLRPVDAPHDPRRPEPGTTRPRPRRTDARRRAAPSEPASAPATSPAASPSGTAGLAFGGGALDVDANPRRAAGTLRLRLGLRGPGAPRSAGRRWRGLDARGEAGRRRPVRRHPARRRARRPAPT